ncbi:hypothetical protein ACFZB5_17545 [Streptomyces nodosus]|uniref:hypothetical protein n=1 Tax=Streptomyces nodosus TaxID=40318 RepID=UPI0036EA4C96
MTSAAVSPLDSWDAVPEGTQWPTADTLVLLNRPLRPGTDTNRLSRFSDDRWDLDPAIFEEHAKATSLNFLLLPRALRLDAKYYIWQLLNHDKPGTLRRANGDRTAVRTVKALFVHFNDVLDWLDKHGITAFGQITPGLLDTFLDDLIDETLELEYKYRRLTEIRRLWTVRSILPERMRLPAGPPWGGEESHELLGKVRGTRDNKTARINELCMQHLLLWSIRFIEYFADDIVAAYGEYAELHERGYHRRLRTGRVTPGRRMPHGEVRRKVSDYLDHLRKTGMALPGKRDEHGNLSVNWSHLGRILGIPDSFQRTASAKVVSESGVPVAEDAYLDTAITGQLDGDPWITHHISYFEAPTFARMLSTACFTVVAYLSGARPGEVLNLRRGCIEHDEKSGLWLMKGLYFKNAVDADGNKIPEGELRRDPWVVVEIVARAVNVLERLHPHPLLFPTRIAPFARAANDKRQGQARPDNLISEDLNKFVSWVNAECRRRGRTDAIPLDPSGPLAASRFRRTLAWFIRRRPRGLVAASIQYGHVHTRLLQGYAGSYESGFPDEYAFEDWLYRIEILAEDARALDEGEHVSGPAADAYRQRVNGANRQFAGHVVTSDRQARDLLGNPLLQIFHGDGMTCVLEREQAACQLRGTVGDPLVTPDTDDCRPQCRNIARTDRDIEVDRRRHEELVVIVDDPLAPTIRHERDLHELQRLQQILDEHEKTRGDRK